MAENKRQRESRDNLDIIIDSTFERESDAEENNLKKKRTLQYYKILFYNLEAEIQILDFQKLMFRSVFLELIILILHIILYKISPKDFETTKENKIQILHVSPAIFWLHALHFIHLLLGFVLAMYMPSSNDFIENLENYPGEKLGKTIFNDLIRESIYDTIIKRVEWNKYSTIIYIILTLIILLIDFIDFFSVYSIMPNTDDKSRKFYLAFLLISYLYMINEIFYYWGIRHLKYVIPRTYLKPIQNLIGGVTKPFIDFFKIRKKKTNVKDIKQHRRIDPDKNPREFFSKKNKIIENSLENKDYIKKSKTVFKKSNKNPVEKSVDIHMNLTSSDDFNL